MAIGTALGLGLIGGSIGASLFGAHQQAKAANQASAQQQQAANRALDLQQQQYERTRQDLAPYLGAGTQGLSALTSLLGVGGPAGPAAAPSAPPGPGVAVPRPPGMPVPLGGPTAPTGGGMVLLRAPTGQTQAVPADRASFFLARGATRV